MRGLRPPDSTLNARRRRSPRSFRDSVWRSGITILVLAAAYGVYLHIMEWGRYSVRRLVVDGVHLLSPETVVEASGVTRADNILFMDLTLVEHNVERLPHIKSCVATRTFPDTVNIRVVERRPVATLAVHNQRFEIDEDLAVLRKLRAEEAQTGPLITQVPGLGAVEVGQQLDGQKHRELREAVAVWVAFSRTDPGRALTVAEIAAASATDVRMYCDELPFEIRWGRGGVYGQAARLNALWLAKKGNLECREYLDLRFGEDVVWR